jgi:TatD DNase family protein
MWIDAHAHLYDLDDAELSSTVVACRDAGVDYVLNTGNSLESSETVIRQCRSFPDIYGAAGISPFDANRLNESWPAILESMLSAPQIIAIGETGIDSTNTAYPDMKLQTPLFEQQLSIAREHDIPIIVHSRGCESLAVDICKTGGVVKAMFHCFAGSIADLKKCLDAGYYVSFSGIITFKNSKLSELVEYIPLERMLIETDSPYLAPAPFRGKKNRPDLVVYVGKKLSEIKKISEAKAAEALKENFRKLFFLENR